jgi:hypothetical protein
MLQQLDSVIAFSVVMLTLSLIITALVQIVLASFDLRGLNLVWALTRLFHQIDPAFEKELGKRKWWLGELFKPTMGRRLAQAISRYKPLGSGIVGRAKAIRSDELLLVLKKMAKDPPANLAPEVQDAVWKLVNERVPGKTATIHQAEAIANNLAKSLDPALKAQINTRLEDAVRNAVGTVSRLEHQTEQWFDTVMDRSSEIFSAHSKVYTFVFAAVLAFVWHIDSGQIYHQISTNSDVRDNLNRAADSVMAQGDKLVESQHVTVAFRTLADNSTKLPESLKEISTLSCSDEGAAWLTTNSRKLAPYENEITGAIKQACANNAKAPDFAGAFKPVLTAAAATAGGWSKAPPGLTRCSDGIRWIQNSGTPFPNLDASGEFQKECELQASATLGEVGDNITKLKTTLEDSKLQVATSLLHYGGKDVTVRPFNLTGYGYWPHLMGTLATVLLLSLGAPFWFNTLRQLSNLKPAVAQKMEEEDSAETDEAATAPSSPPTAKAATGSASS